MRVPLKNYLEKLGLSKLKKEQKEIVTSVLNGKDIIGVLPTGFGKKCMLYSTTYDSYENGNCHISFNIFDERSAKKI